MKLDKYQKKELKKVGGAIVALMIISGSFGLGFNNLLVGIMENTLPQEVPITEIAAAIPDFIRSILPQEIVSALPFL